MTVASETRTAPISTAAVVAIADTDFGFTDGELALSNVAWISCITNNANVTWSGEDPSDTLGHPVIQTATLTSNAPTLVEGKENVANIRLIALGGSSVVTITIGR